MRKILAFICCLMLVVCFAACGETQETATDTTDSFNPLAFDTKIVAQLTQTDLEMELLFDKIETLTNGFDISEATLVAGQNMRNYANAIKEIVYPEGDYAAEFYQTAAGLYINHMVLFTTYLGLLGLETEGYGLDNPETIAILGADNIEGMQELVDNEGNLEEINTTRHQVMSARYSFLLDCGEFKDEDAVAEHIAQYPYPVEH